MPLHWDWDEYDCSWPSTPRTDHHHSYHHHLYAPFRRYWPWDNLKCAVGRQRRTYWTHDLDVCARDWNLHLDDSAWCHGSCLVGRVILETGDEPGSSGKGTFKVIIDVHHFRAEELVVKAKNNDVLLLEGKQADDRSDKGPLCITREFSRRYKLPRNYDATQARATLSADGILTITVPAPAPLDDVERVVDIELTGNYFGSNADPTNAKAIENSVDAGDGDAAMDSSSPPEDK